MAVNREHNFNRIQHLFSEIQNPDAKDIAMAQMANDFHKDKRQEELIDQLAACADRTERSAESLVNAVDRLEGTINKLNEDTASLQKRLYGRLNALTAVIALAAVVQVAVQLAQIGK